ncbi:unnamed protein product [Linum trigynum]|uniref:Uncharacterized protein n=1 Tax=Linum trigynum TaxID=586398 RepID=A0AAV2CGV3_9ROSI
MTRKRKLVTNEGEVPHPTGPYFQWNESLNALLIECMLEMTQRHQVEDGSFKNGAFFGAGEYDARELVRNQSGCGWNNVTKTPTLDDDVFEALIKNKAIKKENKTDNAIAVVAEELGGLKPIISKALDALGSIVGDSEEEDGREAALMAEIGKIQGLERCQVLDAAMTLVENDRKTRLFYALDNEEDKKYFIQNLLR